MTTSNKYIVIWFHDSGEDLELHVVEISGNPKDGALHDTLQDAVDAIADIGRLNPLIHSRIYEVCGVQEVKLEPRNPIVSLKPVDASLDKSVGMDPLELAKLRAEGEAMDAEVREAVRRITCDQ